MSTDPKARVSAKSTAAVGGGFRALQPCGFREILFLAPVGPGLPGGEADRNQNGFVCNNGREQVYIDDRVGGPNP
jgi:hypothetical protein